MARDITPLVSSLGQTMLDILTPIEAEKAQETLSRISHWYGDMSENSVGATVFATWQYFFYKTLMKDQIKDDSLRLALVGNYPFIDYV
jgi:hypothetical protein